ncbi:MULTISPECIES: TolC family outer membrane protein [unclassified Pseudomonas]|uniref:TolC family outer membrane protein n=1 Tax=unclassified Pseudomonas TaxID=196821 RepID=UPI002AC9CEB2|nr:MULTISPECIES: TolC family outer membrane protein [unclassified Pseudomonas]MEB0042389.1 TolC family outer membrane protein [Pseudomonas sp. MH10]MEB0079119.1 TolC family outer membrane protein [Pseudomonas sp. MH10out]MEB0092074.1 TolC family outer membrane protein [Pseudomonas sp. CCI4.2]MEB0100501.1 TolC family outer membrane protein [Pseudomonas sp. CCI3.2]MEB0122700.1 TolC family outer membrane protein [Pseudomonas sp. CCI1.2]
MRVLNPLCSAILLAMTCANAQAMSITEAIQSTIQYHPEIHSNSNNRLAANEDVKIAKGGYLPTVDLVAGYGREGTDSPTSRALTGNNGRETLNYTQSELRLRQMLFDGFNTPNEVQRTQSVVNSRAYYVQGVSEDVALRAIEVYLDVLKRRELLTLAKNNLQAHLRINDQIGLRSTRGVGTNADLDQSKARRALAEDNFYTAQVDLADAEANFFSAVGRMPDELETPPTIKGQVPVNLVDAQHSMLENNPYLKSAQADVQSAESQYEVAKSPFYPRFDAELATGANENLQGEPGYDNEWRAAVVMNYNLFNGSRDKARLQGDAYRINQSMDIRDNALRTLNENLSLAWHAMNNAHVQTPIAREYAETTTKVRAAYQDQFGLGQRTLLDLLDSENELFNAARRYTEVRYTEEYSMYRVLATTGDLLRQLRVVLPAEAVALSDVKSEAHLPELK